MEPLLPQQSRSSFEDSNSVPRPPPPKYWGPWVTIGLGAAVLAVFVVAQSIVALAFVIYRIITNPALINSPTLPQVITELGSNGLLVSIATFASALTGLGVIILFIRIRRGASLPDYLAVRPLRWRTFPILFGVTVILIVAIELMGSLFGQTSADTNSMFTVNSYETAGSPVLLWLAFVIVGPAFEEAFFRGFLFRGLLKPIGAVGTIVITALVFGLLHLQYNFVGMTVVFILGIVLGTIRFKTGSLWGSFAFHAFWNLLQLVLVVLLLNGILK